MELAQEFPMLKLSSSPLYLRTNPQLPSQIPQPFPAANPSSPDPFPHAVPVSPPLRPPISTPFLLTAPDAMSEGSPKPAIPPEGSSSEEQWRPDSHAHPHTERKSRFPRACTARTSARLSGTSPAPSPPDRKASAAAARREREERLQCSRIITPLVDPAYPAELPRRTLRSMWELASLLNFLHVFRPLLNVAVEFTVDELETALISPNSTLADVHIPLLKAIPPVTRMALGRATWVTVLCRKLRDWWHWVADGDIPITSSQGAENEAYNMLEPAMRVLILKAICDIRVEQEDIRNYIDSSIKHGLQLSTFRGQRFGGDSHGVSYWYEDDPLIGHRLYREIRKIDTKRVKGKGMPSGPVISCQWETVASNLDEFQEVSDKLFESKNRMEASLGKKLKIVVIPEVEKIQKRKERSLKKQHREALLLDSFLTTDGLTAGRLLRDRKPVTYTFDDFDRSINEALKITKKRPSSPEQPTVKRESAAKPEVLANGKSNGSSEVYPNVSYEVHSPKFSEEETDEEIKDEDLDRSNRRRKKPQRYSEKEFVQALPDNDSESDSDDDIMGEAVYDEEYLKNRKRRKISSSSEGDEEYSWLEEIGDDDEDEVEDSLSISEDSDDHYRSRRPSTRSRRGTKRRSADEIQTAPRRSKRSTRPRINYRQYEFSESDDDSTKLDKSGPSAEHSDASTDFDLSAPSQNSQNAEDDEEMEHKPSKIASVTLENDVEDEQDIRQMVKTSDSNLGGGGMRRPQFLDLNELAPSAGFDDGLGSPIKGEDAGDP